MTKLRMTRIYQADPKSPLHVQYALLDADAALPSEDQLSADARQASEPPAADGGMTDDDEATLPNRGPDVAERALEPEPPAQDADEFEPLPDDEVELLADDTPAPAVEAPEEHRADPPAEAAELAADLAALDSEAGALDPGAATDPDATDPTANRETSA
jgi:hypothetical protein